MCVGDGARRKSYHGSVRSMGNKSEEKRHKSIRITRQCDLHYVGNKRCVLILIVIIPIIVLKLH